MKMSKKNHFTTNISIYPSHRHIEVLMFYFVHTVKVCFFYLQKTVIIFLNSSVYAQNTPNIRNEKQQ